MITRLELKNFTAFRELDIDLSAKINVIIGENGTGKTQLLKAAYILNKAASSFDPRSGSPADSFKQVFKSALLGAYRPDRIDQVRQLRHTGSRGDPVLSATYSSDQKFQVRLGTESKIIPSGCFTSCEKTGTFFPAKETMSFLEGMFRDHFSDPHNNNDAHVESMKSVFDDTYMDLAWRLVASTATDADSKAKWLKEDLVNKIGGRFLFAGPVLNFQSGVFQQYVGKHAASTYFAPIAKTGYAVGMAAEGHRKIGILQRLLEIEAIGAGNSGPLFWDEPETNMNPKLMRTLVDALLNLSRNGQQIILATHDYVLLKWLDLLMDKGKEDHIRYHSLYRDGETGQVRLDSADDYRALSSNSIANTFSDLYDAEIERALGAPKE